MPACEWRMRTHIALEHKGFMDERNYWMGRCMDECTTYTCIDGWMIPNILPVQIRRGDVVVKEEPATNIDQKKERKKGRKEERKSEPKP